MNKPEANSDHTTGKLTSLSSFASRISVFLFVAIATVYHYHQVSFACPSVFFGDKAQHNIACQCNATHCDSIGHLEWPNDDLTYLRVVSHKLGARFEQSHLRATNQQQDTTRTPALPPVDYLVEVQVNRRRQQVAGFGGAFTDSATQLISLLTEPVRRSLLDDYFSSRGLDYNMGRVPIGGTDMSTRAYSYNDLPEGLQDMELKHFRLQPEDLLFKIPLIKRVNEMREQRRLPPLKLMAASWSAPGWMKSNRHLVQGRLIGNSSGPFYDAYARYLIRFLHEYEQRNISMWALSPQNEPLTPKRVGPLKINFNSVNFEPHEMAGYLAHSLVPNLLRAGKTPDKLKMFIWDDCLQGLAQYQQAALSAANVRHFTSGLSLHWYSQGLSGMPYKHLYEARRQLPGQYTMMSTEASFIGRPRPGEWQRGERYARDLIENLRAGSVGWIDWNLALNMSGGPTWSNNILDSGVLVDLERQTYYKNPMYYALAHVTRFIEPGSHIVSSAVYHNHSMVADSHSNSPTPIGGEFALQPETAQQKELDVVAAELEEPLRVGVDEIRRRIAVVVQNRASSGRRIQLSLAECKAKQSTGQLVLDLPANSLTSLGFNC